MTSTFLRPALAAILAAASLAGCGGKATFDINVSVFGLAYPGLILVEKKSGQTITITDITKTTFSFPNTIEYGTEYEVDIAPNGQPPHQTCSKFGGTSDSAGRTASINAQINCVMNQQTVGGSVTLAPGTTGSYVGLKLINGSNDLNPISFIDTSTAAYGYPGIVFNTPYGITIFAQPTDQTIKCKLVPKVAHMGATDDKVAGIMGDVNVVIDIVCAKTP